MTSLSSDLKAKQPEHDAINADLMRWLDRGGVIERLGNTPMKKEPRIKFNNQEKVK